MLRFGNPSENGKSIRVEQHISGVTPTELSFMMPRKTDKTV